MKDKEKQIEEMAKIMANCDITCNECFEQLESVTTTKIKEREQHCQAYMFAKRAIESGYRKIPEDAVVMSKEKYQELFIKAQKSATQWIDLEREEKIRKQTAREILEELLVGFKKNFYLKNMSMTEEEFGWVLDEIAKQFGVEVEK